MASLRFTLIRCGSASGFKEIDLGPVFGGSKQVEIGEFL